MRIMITGINGMLDSGEIALLTGAVTSLKKLFPDTIFYMGSTNGEIDEIQLKKIFPEIYRDIRLIKGYFSPNIPWTLRTALLFPKYIPAYLMCDVGLHIGGDGYSDIAWHNILSLTSPVSHSYQLLLGWIFRKPTVACAMSIGTFNTNFTRLLARFTLDRVSLITVREKITKEYLENLGVVRPIHLVADLAFLVEPCDEYIDSIFEEYRIKKDKLLVCIAPSQVIPYRLPGTMSNNEKQEIYIRTMASVIDYLAAKGLEVVILCQTSGGRHDDREVAREIQKCASYKPCILDNRICTPQQIKAIIGRCEIMISSKLHSSIAATSMYVPTVTLAYHPKIYGIIGDMLGQQDLIIDIRISEHSKLYQDLIVKIEKCWLLRTDIRKVLFEKGPLIRKMASNNILLISELLRKNNNE